MKVILIFFLMACFAFSSEKWESSDGKTITADFVRLEDDSLTLVAEGKEYSVPLSRLSKKSQDYARFMQEKMKEWAAENVEAPIIAESVLHDVVAFDASLAEGKAFLMEGNVKTIEKSSSLGASPLTTAVIELEAGTRMEVDMASAADGKMTKVKIDTGRVVLTKAKTYSDGKWKDFEESEVLMEKGQAFVFRTSVEKGKITCSGVATKEEIERAKRVDVQRPRELTAEEKASLGRLRMRAEYLESQLSDEDTGGKGVLDEPSKYSKAELEAMQKEIEGLKMQLKVLDESEERSKPRFGR
jgi:hypothetical protein